MTTKSTRQKAIEWWNNLDEDYKSKLFHDNIPVEQRTQLLYRDHSGMTGREVELIYTKIYH